MIDLSAIPVMDLIERLDLKDARLTSGGDEVNFSCFGGEHSDGGSAYMNVDTTAWFCHGCKRRGNAITLVMEVRLISRPTAERWLRDAYGVEFDQPIGGSAVAEVDARFLPPAVLPEPLRPPASWLRAVRFRWSFEPHGEPHHYMLDRGFSNDVLTEWDIGYDYLSERITIPVFDVDGELVGFKGRGWRADQDPKYLILGDRAGHRFGFQPYEATDYVFGLHRNREYRKLVLCEGELNAVALSQMGVPRPAALGMSYFSERHAQLIMREADEVIVFLDHGSAGWQGVWGFTGANGRHRPGIVDWLEPHMTVRIVQPPPDDPAEMLKLGQQSVVLDLLEHAPTSLAMRLSFA